MGKAVEIIEQIMQQEENYAKYGLKLPAKARKWSSFNMLVGENGAGKSRILHMVEEDAKKQCTVVFLDFAQDPLLSYQLKEDFVNVEENTLVDKLVFGDQVENELFLNFLSRLNEQILLLFKELYGLVINENNIVNRRARKILDEINSQIIDILHRKIKINEDGIYLCKEDRETKIAEEWRLLSPGERSILVVVLSVFFIKLIKTPCILLIDEMETHLHPDAQIKLYKFLKQALEDSVADFCVCIASHSIFLLPLFDIREIVYMNNGSIQKLNGGLYQQVYDNLTGEGEKKEESLTDFLYSISAWQYADYLSQCFLAPETVDEAKSDDEQTLKFVEVLKVLRNQKNMLEVLDFGAGSVRVGRCIELMLKDNADVSKLLSRFKYHVYDKGGISEDFKENFAWMGRAFKSEGDIVSSGIKFDIILLYNVLHEIGIDEWVKELDFILDHLTEDGYILFGEREVLSVGEKPYGKSGYLVLGEEELSKLFPASEIKEVILPENQKTVTLCFAVKKPKTRDGYPSEENVKATLQSLRDNTKSKIRNREKNGLGEKGKSRKYAFYCQQYVNAEEALEIMEETSKQDKNIPKSSLENKFSWGNENTTLADIIQSNLTKREKLEKIKQLAEMDTEQGRECKKYLETHKEK